MHHAAKGNRTEDIIYISRSQDEHSHLITVEYAEGGEEEEEGRVEREGKGKRGLGHVYVVLGTLLDIATSFFTFQDLRKPREGEVTTGKVDRNEPGR